MATFGKYFLQSIVRFWNRAWVVVGVKIVIETELASPMKIEFA